MKSSLILRNIISNSFLFFDNLMGLNDSKTIVLCFHGFSNSKDRYSISTKQFENIINKISKTSDFIKLQDIEKGFKKSKNQKVLITIDDGFKNVLDILPITEKYKIKPVLFIVSNSKKINRKELGNKNELLSLKDIKFLISKGWIIGSHSATHPDFKKLNSKEVENEVIKSRKTIENNINKKVNAFAYPRGFYNDEIKNSVIKAKYKYGFTIDGNFINKASNKYLLPRVIVDKTHTVSQIPAIYTNSWLATRRLTNKYKLWERFLS